MIKREVNQYEAKKANEFKTKIVTYLEGIMQLQEEVRKVESILTTSCCCFIFVVDKTMGSLSASGKGYHSIGDRKLICLNEIFVKFVLVLLILWNISILFCQLLKFFFL